MSAVNGSRAGHLAAPFDELDLLRREIEAYFGRQGPGSRDQRPSDTAERRPADREHGSEERPPRTT